MVPLIFFQKVCPPSLYIVRGNASPLYIHSDENVAAEYTITPLHHLLRV